MRLLILCRHIAIALVAVLASALVTAAMTGGLALAYTSITNTEVDKLWRKATGPLAMGFNPSTPEFAWIRMFKELEIAASLREMTFPVDLREDKNITRLPEGGRRATPSTVNAVDATVALTHANGRFTVAHLAQWAGTADGARSWYMDQLKWEGKKKIQAMGRVLGNEFYGFSTGTLFVVDGNPAADTTVTFNVRNGHGSTLIPGTTTAQKEFICNLVRAGAAGTGDKIAIVRSGSLLADSIGNVDSVDNTVPSVTATFAGSVDLADGDLVIFANGANATTIAHTSYQRHLLGLLDLMTSTSVQGISSSTEPRWRAHSDTAGGRMNVIRWRKLYRKIAAHGRENPDVITLTSEGVENDWFEDALGAVQLSGPQGMEQDGNIKLRGREPKTSPYVPPGMLFMWDKQAFGRKTIHDDVTPQKLPNWKQDGQDSIDDKYRMFDLDWAGFIATKNRQSLAYASALTEQ